MAAAAKGAREQIAFYASTPAYRPVLELHGWGDLQPELNTLSKRGEWEKMGELIDDDVLNAFAVVAPLDEVATEVRNRFDDIVDRFSFYTPYKADPEIWKVRAGRLPLGLAPTGEGGTAATPCALDARVRLHSMWLEDGKVPNWAEQVTAIATAVSSLALLSAIGAVIFAARQARETRIGRQAETAVEFFRRWNESSLEETRRLVAQFETNEALRDAMVRFIAENSQSAYVLYRELDYFEQLGALEKHGGFDFELIRSFLGQRLIDRWEMWQPTIEVIGGRSAYPMFDRLVAKVRAAG